MLYDAKENAVRPQRAKEESHDYRYFPDPDLPPLVLSTELVAEQQATLPELPARKRERFVAQYALSQQDASVLTASRAVADYYEAVVHAGADAKAAANWVMGEVLADAKAHNDQLRTSPGALAQLIGLVRAGTLSHQAPKRVFGGVADRGGDPRNVAAAVGLVPGALVQRLTPHPLGEEQRLVPGRVEPARRRVPIAQRLHHVLERHRHVALYVRVRQVPAAVLEHQLERPLPALALREAHHPAEQATARVHAGQGRRDDGVEVRVARGVVLQNELLRLGRAGRPQVRLEAALPGAVAEGRRARREAELARHEEVVGHAVGGEMGEVAVAEGAQRIGGSEVEDLLAHMPGVAMAPHRGVLFRHGRVGRDVVVQKIVRERPQQVRDRARELVQIGEHGLAQVNVGARRPGVRRARQQGQRDEREGQGGERALQRFFRPRLSARRPQSTTAMPRRTPRSVAATSSTADSPSS